MDPRVTQGGSSSHDCYWRGIIVGIVLLKIQLVCRDEFSSWHHVVGSKEGSICTLHHGLGNLGRNDHQTPAPCQLLGCLEVISPDLPGVKGCQRFLSRHKNPKTVCGWV